MKKGDNDKGVEKELTTQPQAAHVIRVLLKWEIKYHRELTDYEQNLAALEHVVGQTLF